jgi:hypothetical protein
MQGKLSIHPFQGGVKPTHSHPAAVGQPDIGDSLFLFPHSHLHSSRAGRRSTILSFLLQGPGPFIPPQVPAS